MDARFSPLSNKEYAQERKADTWDFTTLGHGDPPSQTAAVFTGGLAGGNVNAFPSRSRVEAVHRPVDKPWTNCV